MANMSNKGAYDWAVQLTDPKYVESITIASSVAAPLGFDEKMNEKLENKEKVKSLSTKDVTDFQKQKAWELATGPAKSIPMNFFMSYMSGTSMQIIPIMTALMLLSGPIKAVFDTKKVFRHLSEYKNENGVIKNDLSGPMVIYILCQFALMGIGLHKLYSMGLFPNTRSDFLAWEMPMQVSEKLRSYAF